MIRDPSASDHADRAQRLREAGLKATGPRLVILEALLDDRRHPTAEMLHDALREEHPTLSRSTVYLTLETFLRKGLIRRIPSSNGKLRVDGTAPDHDHAICRVCGDVYDVPAAARDRLQDPESLPQGLTLEKVNVEYEVLCRGCRTSESKSRKP